jgi:hypothetical protein
VLRGEAEKRRGFDHSKETHAEQAAEASPYFDDLLDSQERRGMAASYHLYQWRTETRQGRRRLEVQSSFVLFVIVIVRHFWIVPTRRERAIHGCIDIPRVQITWCHLQAGKHVGADQNELSFGGWVHNPHWIGSFPHLLPLLFGKFEHIHHRFELVAGARMAEVLDFHNRPSP